MSTNGIYFDLQVNGYGGVSFQPPELTVDDMRRACKLMREHNVHSILATIVTNDVNRIASSLMNIVKLRERDPLIKEMIAGFHIEGPFISSVDGYRGAHPIKWVRPADQDATKMMLDAGGGLVKLVTLAPEGDEGFKVTRYLAQQNVRVSAGHTDASFDQLRGAIDAGLSMFTHLGNGCPMQMHRHENIVQRALSLSESLWPMFIADGAHVAYYALKNYLKVTDPARTIVVTDAVTPAGLGTGTYKMGHWGEITIGEDYIARSPDKSHLLGSIMPMPLAAKNLVEKVGLTQAQVEQLTSTNPRKAIFG